MKLFLSWVGVVAGASLVTWGLYLTFPPAAAIFAGVCLIAAGLFSEGVE